MKAVKAFINDVRIDKIFIALIICALILKISPLQKLAIITLMILAAVFLIGVIVVKILVKCDESGQKKELKKKRTDEYREGGEK